ncbi:MAG: LON peptidase substrate-binding domain-containing protein [Candidatus Thiodiazotropha sp. 'RUGA']|nr:LON peptidase substrate-binding domain-containing protein [Candidatus Thiodiazotropha sp. 'RUGA']
MPNPFITQFQQLPNTIPIFPLAGAIVMPGAQLPLNIFEPRYINMIEDAMASHHLIGMVQPLEQPENSKNEVFNTGCSGRISYYNETPDGRIEIILTGVCRFDIGEELKTTRGYRLITPLWSRFESDYDPASTALLKERKQIELTLERYLLANDLQTDTEQLKQLPTDLLVNVLATALPLPHEDKQSMVETVDIAERLQILVAKLDLSSYPANSDLKH